MDIYELSEEERFGDEFSHKNPKRISKNKVKRIRRESINKAIGKPRIREA